jgi:hypothetical protein
MPLEQLVGLNALVDRLTGLVASWTTFGCLYWYGTNWNWRLPALGQALGGLVQLIAMPFM